jgi:hypothetical protein
MSRLAPGWLITPRDIEMLRALDYAPLTARQLEKLSATWDEPFSSARLARERMQRLGEAKLVTAGRYAILDRGQPENYYLLTRGGYQFLHGPDSQPPTKGYFSPAALARQPHQRAVSDFIVHTICSAHRSGVHFTGFYRENTIRLTANGESVYPDAAFALIVDDDKAFRFFVEVDNSTERVRSAKQTDSIERKIRIYDAVQDQSPDERFRLVFVSAQNSQERLTHILEAADSVMRIRERTLCYGVTLASYLASSLAVTSPIFLDHRGDRQSLVPDINIRSLDAPKTAARPRVVVQPSLVPSAS